MLDLDTVAPGLTGDRLVSGWARYAQAIAAPEQGRRPDFLIVGPPKTGTTWLYANLVDEPDLSLPLQKESRYFSQNWRLFDFAAYTGLIDVRGHGFLGEASPDYFCLPDCVLEAIAGIFPNLKVIILLRQPLERLWSHLKHQQLHREGLYAASAAADPVHAAFHPTILGHLDYAGGLRRWLGHLPKSQIFVGFLEDIEIDPQRFLDRVKHFLGAAPALSRDFDVLHERVNTGSSERPPSALADRLAQHLRPHLLAANDYLAAEFKIDAPLSWTLELDRKLESSPLPEVEFSGLDARLFGRDGRDWHAPTAIFDHQALTETPQWFSVQDDLALVRYRGWLYGVPKPERGSISLAMLEAANHANRLKRAASLIEFETLG